MDQHQHMQQYQPLPMGIQHAAMQHAAMAQSHNPEVKKGRGRPKGSRNKPRDPNSEAQKQAEKRQAAPVVSENGVVKRGRGRPKGSRNKPRDPNDIGNGTSVRGRGGSTRGRGRGRGGHGVPMVPGRQNHESAEESVEEEEDEFSYSS